MAIEFYNIKSGERKIVETDEMVAAYYNSSDLHVNARVGQDMGWRLGPATVKRMKEIQRDQAKLNEIAQHFSLPMGEVQETDIIQWISLEDARKKQAEGQVEEQDHEQAYQDELRSLDEKKPAVKKESKKTDKK